jgi:hypothetical protein
MATPRTHWTCGEHDWLVNVAGLTPHQVKAALQHDRRHTARQAAHLELAGTTSQHPEQVCDCIRPTQCQQRPTACQAPTTTPG